MSATHTAKPFLLTGAALLAISIGVFGTLIWRLRATAPLGRPALTAPAYVPVAVEVPATKNIAWESPAPLVRGRDWLYDVFTPPEIFYQPRTRQFAVSATGANSEEALEAPFGLELVSVRPEPFRLQLIGYLGGAGEGEARGIFENRISGEVFLASAGFRVADLALSIKRFVVRTESVAIPESMNFKTRVATAVVHDSRTNRDVTLTQRERHFTGNAFALVALAGEAVPREVRVGDTLTLGTASYRIEKITLDPVALDVTKTAPDLATPSHRTLSVRFDPADSSLTP
jgi:hypothetical protein